MKWQGMDSHIRALGARKYLYLDQIITISANDPINKSRLKIDLN